MRPRGQDVGEERKGRVRFIIPPSTANLTRPKSVNSLLFVVQDEMRDGYCFPNQIIFTVYTHGLISTQLLLLHNHTAAL